MIRVDHQTEWWLASILGPELESKWNRINIHLKNHEMNANKDNQRKGQNQNDVKWQVWNEGID